MVELVAGLLLFFFVILPLCAIIGIAGFFLWMVVCAIFTALYAIGQGIKELV